MIILEIKQVEDCLDGSVIKELFLEEKISSAFIQSLGKEGTLQYFPHFAKPFFKLRIEGKLNLKGIEGNTTLRVRIETPVKQHINLLIELLQRH